MVSLLVGGTAPLHGGVAIVLVIIPAYLVISAIIRNTHWSLLCTGCEQCTAACPVVPLSRGRGRASGDQARAFVGPRAVMAAMQGGSQRQLYDGGLDQCLTCRICTERCPWGLDPESMVRAGRRLLFERGEVGEAQREVLETLAKTKNVFGDARAPDEPPEMARRVLAAVERADAAVGRGVGA